MLIGEVARRCGVSTRMLRHYDTLGLVRPTGRSSGGYREYSDADLRRIFHVESLRTLGLSLRQIGQALQDPGFEPAALVADLIARTEDRIRREQELLDRLRTVDASSPTGWAGVLRLVELLHGLNSPSAARRQQAALAPTEDVPADVLTAAILTETDPIVAGALRWALARSDTPATIGLAAGLSSPDPQVRRRAVLALAAIPDDEATTVLTGALDDDDAQVRGPAALALARRGVTAAVPALVALVVAGTNDVEAAELLGELALLPGRAGPILAALTAELASSDAAGPAELTPSGAGSSPAKLSASGAGSGVRIRVVQALAELPTAVTRDLLAGLTGDPDRGVAALATALGRRRP
ncbi:MerR family transcriptional regulator [Actinoplanes sp. HUAS TT8]|uniref:MerR family transcriptional regulator n=1 Tax=Actinoplanes sp. HUAS TT8 TaxID=3447453 RepID=UPI003F527360